MIEEMKKYVSELLNNDDSGHGMDHINRVLKLSLEFAEKEYANKELVAIIALLHDVDDYKLFGKENAENLINAKRIMNNCNVNGEIQNVVCSEIKRIGYSKLLNGLRPRTLEGQIVSDADMCDALGAIGILRASAYSLKNGKPFFDRNIFPIENIDLENYTSKCAESTVCHLFEKTLKLKNLMLTSSGKEKAIERHNIIIDFLNHLFDEENAEEWKKYLNEYILKV